MTDLPQARAAKELLRARLGEHDEVVGVGIARTAHGYCVRVNVSSADAAAEVPHDIDGVEVRTTVVGRITAQT